MSQTGWRPRLTAPKTTNSYNEKKTRERGFRNSKVSHGEALGLDHSG